MPWNALKDGAGRGPAGSDGLHVVGRQHPRVTGALHGPVHPAIVDLLHVDDGVPILEGDLILVGGAVVVDSAVPLLRGWRTVSPGPSPLGPQPASLTVGALEQGLGSSEPGAGRQGRAGLCLEFSNLSVSLSESSQRIWHLLRGRHKTGTEVSIALLHLSQ